MTKEADQISDVTVRSRRAIKSTGLKQKEFALKLDISSAHLSAILNGREALTTKIISLIALHAGVNKDWLLTGEGDMFALEPTTSVMGVQSSINQNLPPFASIPLPSPNPMLDRFPELNQVVQAACTIWKDLDPVERHRLAMQMMADITPLKK